MKVIQCYSSRFLGYYEPFRVDSLIASAIQWKEVYPNDFLILAATEDIIKYVTLRLQPMGRCLPWNEIQVRRGYPNHDTEFYYDYVRFLECAQQKEPFIFLDPDVFIFRELLKSDSFSKVRKELENPIKEHFISYLYPYKIPGYFSEDLSNYPKSVQDCLGELPFSQKMINTGFFLTTPGIVKRISKKVLEVQECFSRDIGESGYKPQIHEFASSTVPLMVLAKENVSLEVATSEYILHTCNCLFPPESCFKDCAGYYGRDAGDGGEPVFSRRLTCYKEIWSRIMKEGYISYSDFVEVFMNHWREEASKNSTKVKKGPILI